MLPFKRIVCLLLAAVMVAGMMPPVSVGAVETTEPLPVEETAPAMPETTVAEETEETAPEVPETTVAEETEETAPEVPETTVAEETAPAETEPAPVPETTVPTVEPEEIVEEQTVAEEICYAEVALPDGEILYREYLDRLFFGDDSIEPLGTLAREMLSAADQYIYDVVKEKCVQVASGEAKYSFCRLYMNSAGFGGHPVDVGKVIDALMNDCPYELYWFDGYWWYKRGSQLDIGLIPRNNYKSETFDEYNPSVDTEKTGRAAAAAENSRSIVAEYASYSDYDKLAAYADKICALVEYDHHAADYDTWDTNINPWTLVNVFDNDPDTNVVCEGYAEAFQYLCDQSEFQREIACYSPCGANHKWNIVRINGISYLMDVTHCDYGTKADRREKFLDGGKGSVKGGYVIGGFHYWYYDEIQDLWGTGDNSILRLSETPYDPAKDPDPPKVIASGTCGEGLTWELNDAGTLTISGTGAMDDFAPWDSYKDTITEVIIGDGVTGIGAYAFYGCKNMKTIGLHDGITAIGTSAFEGCEALESVHIPGGLQRIEDNTFAVCRSLAAVTLPSGLEEIGKLAFYACESLNSIVIPDKVTVIGANAFGFCSNAKTLVLGKSVREIRDAAFSNCKAITSVEIPNTVEILGEGAFVDCWGLKSIEIPGSIEELGMGAFSICKGLETVVIHEGVQSIGGSAFTCAKALHSVTLPDSLKEIGEGAFSSCWKLEEVVIPKNTESIGKHAFDWCKALKTIVFLGKAPVIDEEAFGDFATPQTGVKATVYHPCDRSWTKDNLQDYGGKLKWIMDPTLEGHNIAIDPAVAPTCTESGLTEGSHCGDCGEILVEQQLAAFVGHNFEEGICTNCGAEDKPDYGLFSGKTLKLQETDPETGKPYTAKQISWELAPGSETVAVLKADGSLTAPNVYEKSSVTAIATIAQEKRQFCRRIDIYPVVTQVEAICDGESVANNGTVFMDFSDDSMDIRVGTYPVDTLANVTWTVSDKKGQFAAYEIDGDVLTISNPTGKAGTVTIKATVDAGVKKTVTVKVQFGSYAKTVEITEPEKSVIKGGESLKLTAEITEPDVVSKPGIVWTSSNKTAATVSNGTVKAKNVAHPTTVIITATSKDGQASDSVEIKILPKNEGQLVLMNGSAFVTNATKSLNVEDTYQLDAAVITNGEPVAEEVTWTTSKAKVATVENGLITAVGNGTAKITAQVGKTKASITIKVTTLVDDMEITTKDGKNLVEENGETMVLVSSGKAVNLVASILTPGANKTVTWEITEGKAYAKVSNGKVTANKDITDVVYLTVRATAKDGSGYFEEITVKVVPLATGVQIYQNGTRVRSNTTFVCDMLTNPTLKLSARVYPAKANQKVELTSSNKKIADFVDGELVCYKPGTVTITAKALDGSNQKATFKLTIVKKVQSLTLKEGANLTVTGGKSLKLAPMVQISPSDATNKKLTWKVSDNDFGIKISTSGVLTTKKVKESVTVNIMVTAQDGSGKMLSFDVTVKPV